MLLTFAHGSSLKWRLENPAQLQSRLKRRNQRQLHPSKGGSTFQQTWGFDQRIMGCQWGTRLFQLVARCSIPWQTQWLLCAFIYLKSGFQISGAVPSFRHPCMLPVKHSMVRQLQQKQLRKAQLRPKLCGSLFVARCHESPTEGPSGSLGETHPITQDFRRHVGLLGANIRKLDSWELVLKNSYGHSVKNREQCRSKVAKKAVAGPATSTQPVEEKPEAHQLYGKCNFSTNRKSH